MHRTTLRLLAALALCTSTALAQTNASAKSAVQLSDQILLPKISLTASSQTDQISAGPWTKILSTTMKSSSNADVLIGVSLEAGLFTDTLVSSKQGQADSAKAEASIEVQVLVDGKPASPGNVIFAKRAQSMMAVFGGIMQSCRDTNADGIITAAECTWTDEQLQLVLNTMNANHFDFALTNLGTGIHTFEVKARIALKASAQAGTAQAAASVGKGSLTVEAVRFTNDFTL